VRAWSLHYLTRSAARKTGGATALSAPSRLTERRPDRGRDLYKSQFSIATPKQYPSGMGGGKPKSRAGSSTPLGAWWRWGIAASAALVIGAIYTGETALTAVAISAIAGLWAYAIGVLYRSHHH
jgi:hypothetical protein